MNVGGSFSGGAFDVSASAKWGLTSSFNQQQQSTTTTSNTEFGRRPSSSFHRVDSLKSSVAESDLKPFDAYGKMPGAKMLGDSSDSTVPLAMPNKAQDCLQKVHHTHKALQDELSCAKKTGEDLGFLRGIRHSIRKALEVTEEDEEYCRRIRWDAGFEVKILMRRLCVAETEVALLRKMWFQIVAKTYAEEERERVNILETEDAMWNALLTSHEAYQRIISTNTSLREDPIFSHEVRERDLIREMEFLRRKDLESGIIKIVLSNREEIRSLHSIEGTQRWNLHSMEEQARTQLRDLFKDAVYQLESLSYRVAVSLRQLETQSRGAILDLEDDMRNSLVRQSLMSSQLCSLYSSVKDSIEESESFSRQVIRMSNDNLREFVQRSVIGAEIYEDQALSRLDDLHNTMSSEIIFAENVKRTMEAEYAARFNLLLESIDNQCTVFNGHNKRVSETHRKKVNHDHTHSIEILEGVCMLSRDAFVSHALLTLHQYHQLMSDSVEVSDQMQARYVKEKKQLHVGVGRVMEASQQSLMATETSVRSQLLQVWEDTAMLWNYLALLLSKGMLPLRSLEETERFVRSTMLEEGIYEFFHTVRSLDESAQECVLMLETRHLETMLESASNDADSVQQHEALHRKTIENSHEVFLNSFQVMLEDATEVIRRQLMQGHQHKEIHDDLQRQLSAAKHDNVVTHEKLESVSVQLNELEVLVARIKEANEHVWVANLETLQREEERAREVRHVTFEEESEYLNQMIELSKEIVAAQIKAKAESARRATLVRKPTFVKQGEDIELSKTNAGTEIDESLFIKHEVKVGETVQQIASQYSTSPEAVTPYNTEYKLPENSHDPIPVDINYVLVARTHNPSSSLSKGMGRRPTMRRNNNVDSNESFSLEKTVVLDEMEGMQLHVVMDDDTLESLAEQYNTSVDVLRVLNEAQQLEVDKETKLKTHVECVLVPKQPPKEETGKEDKAPTSAEEPQPTLTPIEQLERALKHARERLQTALDIAETLLIETETCYAQGDIEGGEKAAENARVAREDAAAQRRIIAAIHKELMALKYQSRANAPTPVLLPEDGTDESTSVRIETPLTTSANTETTNTDGDVVYHPVGPKDTLRSISAKYRVPTHRIRAANANITNLPPKDETLIPKTIAKLVIPLKTYAGTRAIRTPSTNASGKHVSPAQKRSGNQNNIKTKSITPPKPRTNSSVKTPRQHRNSFPQSDGIVAHVVRLGETVHSIAKHYDVPQDVIRNLNKNSELPSNNDAAIMEGTVVIIYDSTSLGLTVQSIQEALVHAEAKMRRCQQMAAIHSAVAQDCRGRGNEQEARDAEADAIEVQQEVVLQGRILASLKEELRRLTGSVHPGGVTSTPRSSSIVSPQRHRSPSAIPAVTTGRRSSSTTVQDAYTSALDRLTLARETYNRILANLRRAEADNDKDSFAFHTMELEAAKLAIDTLEPLVGTLQGEVDQQTFQTLAANPMRSSSSLVSPQRQRTHDKPGTPAIVSPRREMRPSIPFTPSSHLSTYTDMCMWVLSFLLELEIAERNVIVQKFSFDTRALLGDCKCVRIATGMIREEEVHRRAVLLATHRRAVHVGPRNIMKRGPDTLPTPPL